MRTLSDTLKKAQQSGFIDALVKIVLTYGETSYTYTKDRILDIKKTGNGNLQAAEITLDNNDGELTALDLKGYKGVLSSGAITSAGEEYSACAPMWVLAQEFDSDPNKLTCTLTIVGICNLMSTDEASGTYQPDEDDTKSVKTLVNQIAGATLACFNLCKAFEVVWDDGYDTLADTYKPKDAFRIYAGNNRNSAIDRLLDYTLNVKVVKADGKIHIFKPTTSGETYDYEYSLESGHPFFAKALRNRLVTPNYIKVQSRDDDDPQYSGTAQDDSYATLPDELKKHHFKKTYLESDDQAEDIAEAMLAKAQMWCEAGSANVPHNVGAEVYDYVKVTDEREKDYRVGNIGKLTWHYTAVKNRWEMTFAFGNWQNVRKALADLGITSDDLENYFSRLSVGDLYAEHILADNMDFVWIDPGSNMIDSSKLTSEFIDSLPDGEYYYRARTMHLDGETGLTLWEGMKYYIRFSPDSDEAGIRRQDTAPSGVETGEYWIDTSGAEPIIKRWTGSAWFTIEQAEIDALNKGILTAHAKMASLSPDGLVLLDKVKIGDDYGLVLKNDISGGHVKGTAIVQSSSARLVTDSEKDDWDDSYDLALTAYDLAIEVEDDMVAGKLTLSQYTDISGTWYKTGGVKIHASNGIVIYGKDKALVTRASEFGTDQCYVGSDGCIYAAEGNIKLGRSGLYVDGEFMFFQYSGSTRGRLRATSAVFYVEGQGGAQLTLSGDDIVISPGSSGVIYLLGKMSDLSSQEYMDLPRKSSPPTGYEGRMVFNPNSGFTNIYRNGAWVHINYDTGWA